MQNLLKLASSACTAEAADLLQRCLPRDAAKKGCELRQGPETTTVGASPPGRASTLLNQPMSHHNVGLSITYTFHKRSSSGQTSREACALGPGERTEAVEAAET